MRIVLCYPVETQHIKQISAAFPEAEVVAAGQERIAEEILEADIFCGHAKVPVPWDEVVRRGRLRWIQSSAAGLDHCLVPEVVASEILVSSASGVLAPQVTDHTRGPADGLFAEPTGVLCRGSEAGIHPLAHPGPVRYDRRHCRHGRQRAADRPGSQGISRLRSSPPIGSPTPIRATSMSCILPEKLDEILPRVDSLILAAPLTSETRGMMDARRLSLMKGDAVLVNVARGPLVVEADLVDALEGRPPLGRGCGRDRGGAPPGREPVLGLSRVRSSPPTSAASGRVGLTT